MSFLRRGSEAYRAGDLNEAMACFDAAVAGDVTNWRAAGAMGNVHLDAGRLGHAYLLLSAAVRLDPNADTVSDLGRVLTHMGDWEAGLDLFEKAHEIDPTHIQAMNNAGLACVHVGRYDDAWDWFCKASPETGGFLANEETAEVERNKAWVHLFRQDWERGWKAYDLGLGHGDRVKRFGGVMPWSPLCDPDQPTVIYGEQGIGDEVMFASCLPDAMERLNKPIIETMPRLVGLFSRSFPTAQVYGTRYDRPPYWFDQIKPSFAASIGQLPGMFRNRQEDFPGKPYLTACSARRAAVKGLLAPMPRKMKIGIAWKGGTAQTDFWDRCVDLNEMMGVLGQIDAEFISLEHTLSPDEEPELLGVHVFPWLTHRDLDYDNTAALVSELDLVVAVPTAVAHLAGALGVKTIVMLNKHPAWRCGGPTMPWYDSMEVMRDWAFEDVRARIGEVLSGAE